MWMTLTLLLDFVLWAVFKHVCMIPFLKFLVNAQPCILQVEYILFTTSDLCLYFVCYRTLLDMIFLFVQKVFDYFTNANRLI